MKQKLTIAAMAMSAVMFGQKFQKAELTTFDGTHKQGYVNAKQLSGDKEFDFKTSESGSVERLKSSDIKAITFTNNEGQKFDFENVTILLNPKKNKTENQWMLRVVSGYYDLYTVANYSFDKNDDLILTVNYLSGVWLPTQNYYIKKKGEKIANLFGIYSSSPTIFGLQKLLYNSVKNYMSDNPQLISDVKSKKYKPSDMAEIVTIYNNSKN